MDGGCDMGAWIRLLAPRSGAAHRLGAGCLRPWVPWRLRRIVAVMSQGFGIFSGSRLQVAQRLSLRRLSPAMPATPDKTQRLLDLIAFMVARRFEVTRAQIWDGVEGYAQAVREGTDEKTVRRMFERDKKDLLDLGFPLETVERPLAEAGEQQLYRLRARDFYLPYLRLLAEGEEGQHPKAADIPRATIAPERAWLVAESLSVLRSNPDLPLADAAESAFRKLTWDVREPEAHFGAAPLIVSGDDAPTRERVDRLNEAVRNRRIARFRYHSIGRDEISDREVEPWALLYKYNRWYLIALDRNRKARRTFRVSRISELKIDQKPAEPHFDAPSIDMTEWHSADAWNLPGAEGEVTPVDVRFEFPRSLWADRNGVGEQVEALEGGAAIRRFGVRTADPFLRWLLSLQDEVAITHPPEHAAALEALREEVARMYDADRGIA